jgi:hypothetical protein
MEAYTRSNREFEMEKKPVHALERMREIYYSHRLMELVRDL